MSLQSDLFVGRVQSRRCVQSRCSVINPTARQGVRINSRCQSSVRRDVFISQRKIATRTFVVGNTDATQLAGVADSNPGDYKGRVSVAWDGHTNACGSADLGSRIVSGSGQQQLAVIDIKVTLDHPTATNQLKVHWACTSSAAPGSVWQPPPQGWKTTPSVSRDAGGGSWQTDMHKVDSNGQHTYVATLEVPLSGPLRKPGGGIAFVLTDGSQGWAKNLQPGGLVNFFAPASPVGGGLLPTHDGHDGDHVSQSTDAADSNDEDMVMPGSDIPVRQTQKFIVDFRLPPVAEQGLAVRAAGKPVTCSPDQGFTKHVSDQEQGSQRSLMHRFNMGHELVQNAMSQGPQLQQLSAMTAVAVWLRMSAQRLLVWNRNYNVKPREISAAQDRLCAELCRLWSSVLDKVKHNNIKQEELELLPIIQLCLASVGRGGQGDVGQRVRDEILDIQHRNNCKGGMMEQWHQKLHNNTSPDDVIICEALLAYCKSDLDISKYWERLHQDGIDAARLASFDRAIRNEPKFDSSQVPGLIRDLTVYLQILRAVHCGTDLSSAAANIFGFTSTRLKGNKKIVVEPVKEVATPELATLLGGIQYLQSIPSTDLPQHEVLCKLRLLELLIAARQSIRHVVLAGDASCNGRHRDVIFFDMALDTTARTTLEGMISAVRAVAGKVAASEGGLINISKASPFIKDLAMSFTHQGYAHDTSLLVRALQLSTHNAALSTYPNDDLAWATAWIADMPADQWSNKDQILMLVSVLDRLKRALEQQSTWTVGLLQPHALQLATHMGMDHKPLATFSEEVIRGTAAAPLSQLLSVLEPSLRRVTGGGSWQVVSRGKADTSPAGLIGGLVRQKRLADVQYNTFEQPTVLLVDVLEGHEEVPEGCVAVLSVCGQCPDMLAHSAVRARNMNVLLAACYDPQVSEALADFKEQQRLCVRLQGSNVTVTSA